MKVQIMDGSIVAFGVEMYGPDVFDGAPDDYEPNKYNYTPNEDGSFNPDGFTPILADENGNPQ